MNIGYIMAGCLFLFNPTVNLIDVLPDVIGYLLILKGLYKLADLNGKIKAARQKFKAAVWIASGELLVMLAASVLEATWYLVFSFVFCVLKLIYLIPAFVNLFEGISYLEMRLTNHKAQRQTAAKPRFGGVFDKTEFPDGTAYFELYEKKNAPNSVPFFEQRISFAGGDERLCMADAGFSSRTADRTVYLYESDEARVFSVIFVIVHAACACLPEFTAIAGMGESVTSNPVDFSGMRTILAFLLAGVSVIFGILWLVRMLRYFDGFRRDRAFIRTLEEKYESEIVPDVLLWTKRKTHAFCTLSIVAFAFFMCLPISGISIGGRLVDSFYFVPEFLWGVVMLAAFRAAGEYAPRRRVASVKAALFVPFSAASYVLLYIYSERFAGSAFPYEEEGFFPVYIAFMICFAFAMVLFSLLVAEKKKVYLRLAARCTELSSAGLFEMSAQKQEERLSALTRRVGRYAALEYLYACFSVLCMAAVPFGEESEIFALSWFFRLMFGIILMIYSAAIAGNLHDELERVV